MTIKYDYWDTKLELTNLYETQKLIEYIFFRNKITFHNKQIVDLGCGWGANTILIACGISKSGYFQIPKKVIGIDYDYEEIKKAKSFSKHLTNINFIYQDITKPFLFDTGSIDICLSTYTIHNLEDNDKQKVFREVNRILCVGGHFIYIDVLFDKESERAIISTKNSLKKMWLKEAYTLDKNEIKTLLNVHLNPKHPFSLILTGREEFPITVSKAKTLGEKENLKVIDVTPVKGLVLCKRIIFIKKYI